MGVESFFNSRIFAVVGASRDSNKVGHVVFKNLKSNHYLKVLPVNPNCDRILGDKCFKDLFEIPYYIDCVIIAVKPEFVLEALKQAGIKKVKCAVVISSGFSEAGNYEFEEKLKDIAKQYNITLLGPNVLGYISPGINATFFSGMPEAGGISFLSQSGAIGTGILDIALKERIGFSGFISLGNSALLDFSDFIKYYSNDKNTRVIALYIEALKEGKGKQFLEACKDCKKPIIALKAGKTEKGITAAFSHTSALASEQGVYEGIFRQAGIIEVDNVRELLDVSNLYLKYGKIGKRACIITNAGGLGVLCTDFCSKNGIDIVKLPDNIKEKLGKILPAGWSKNNPVDILGDALAERYFNVLNLLEKENFFDFFIVLLTPQHMTQSLETADVLRNLKKPVVACFLGGEKVEKARQSLRMRVPVFYDVEDLARSIGKIIE